MVPRRQDEVNHHGRPASWDAGKVRRLGVQYVSSLEYDCMDFNPCGYAVHERC